MLNIGCISKVVSRESITAPGHRVRDIIQKTMKHRYELEFWVGVMVIEGHLSIPKGMIAWFRRWSLRVNNHGATIKLAG